MWWALLSKEFRECGLYAAIALLMQIVYLIGPTNGSLIPIFNNGRSSAIPFLTDEQGMFTQVAVLAAIVVGLQQTVMESWRQTTLLLLHRPIPRTRIFVAKLVAGVSLVLAITVPPLLGYAAWAAIPGTHASPFYWSFTEPYWRGIAAALVCYLGAFLCGIRSARWIGSRTWPLVAALVMVVGLKLVPGRVLLVYPTMLALMALFSVSILEAARRREYP